MERNIYPFIPSMILFFTNVNKECFDIDKKNVGEEFLIIQR